MFRRFFLLLSICALAAGPAALSQPAGDARPTMHVLAIGVDDYGSEWQLEGAVNDATAFVDSLSRFADPAFQVNKSVLLNGSATREALDMAVQEIISTAQRSDVFVFFFAGQGNYGPIRGEGTSSSSFFLLSGREPLPRSVGALELSSFEDRAITPRLLATWLNVIPAENQLVVIDAVDGAGFFQQVVQIDAAERASEGAIMVGNRTVVSVSGLTFEVRTDEGLVHGLLTLGLLEALSEARRSDGIILASSLRNWPRPPTVRPYFYQGGADFPLGTDGAAGSSVGAHVLLGAQGVRCVAAERQVARFQDPACPEIAIEEVAPTVTVSGRAEKIGDGIVFLNGRRAEVQDHRFEVVLPVDAVGEELRLRALNRDGTVVEEILDVSPATRFRSLDGAAEPLAPIRPREGRDMALLFALNEYEHRPDLRNPILDAAAIARELEAVYGFDVHLVRDATRQQIRDTLHYYANLHYADDDRLFVFFAGHGEYSSRIHDGYIVARDTQLPEVDRDRETAVQYNWIRRALAHASSRHVLLVLDVCYGGTFSQRLSESALRSTEEHPLYLSVDRELYISRKMALTTRRYITSGDAVRVPDGLPGQHSPFARRFLEALRTYGGEKGFLTLNDVKASIQLVEPEPMAGGFDFDEPGSDFLFIVRQ